MTDERPIVLVVDDTPTNVELLHRILGGEYTIRVAMDGEKGLNLAARAPRPALILLDIMMPGIDGYEVCRRLKASSDTAAIPIIFITARSGEEDEQKGLGLGAVDYITKPFSPDVVRARVRGHLAVHQEKRALERENRQLRAKISATFNDHSEDSLAALIDAGESETLEFKSTLRWNLHADRSDKKIENACLKTVAGYLNADGGVLLVGVDDDGKLVGLGRDHFKSEDKLLLHWVNLINKHIGAEFVQFIRANVHDCRGERVLVVQCLPSATPAFFNRDNEEAFFVRVTNSTQALKPSEILAYIGQRFTDRAGAGSQ